MRKLLLIALLAAGLIAGCVSGQDEPSPIAEPMEISSATSAPVSTDIPEPTATLTSTATSLPEPTLPSIAEAECIPTGTLRESAVVINIVDGDTIDVTVADEEFRVRYIGIDTPERGDPFFSEAAMKNAELVLDQTITMVKDVSEIDRFDRLLRYVLVGDQFVNYELVRSGFAALTEYPPDISCSDVFFDAGYLALSEEVGRWMLTATPIPSATLSPSFPTSPPESTCDPSYPTVCIPRYPPDLNCGDISYRRFKVIGSDPHGFDRDNDGVGCESG